MVTAYFMGGAYELTGSAVKKYYAIAGMTVAMHDGSALQYFLTDHLGSVVAVTDASGTLTSQQRYLPFGEVRTVPVTSPATSPVSGTDVGFTGQLNNSRNGHLLDRFLIYDQTIEPGGFGNTKRKSNMAVRVKVDQQNAPAGNGNPRLIPFCPQAPCKSRRLGISCSWHDR
jgi:hypothetical protein